ncbi:MobQ family relaxase [Belnapia sp. F-4-1]|uniref:MobQ family relaxase n=1 Tax=Belnapia sp. F-4-1 TaxID=1545443 RepID=UPI00068DC26F|nr:MobQ family relaxase [Belnapia sp. F-4-1]
MACYHLTLKVMSRKAGDGHSAPHGVAYRSGNRGATISTITKVGGVSAVAAAAYRSGQAIEDERQGQTYDYRNKEAILHTEIVLPAGPVPAWAMDRNELWNQVEKAEKRKDAVVAREVEVMLPRELDLADQVKLVRRFIAEHFTAKGLVADFGIHRPTASDGLPHPHCHIMITPRALGPDGFAAKKDTTFWWEGQRDKSKGELGALREAWAALQNEALDEAGSAARVDHRTLVAQRETALEMAQEAREAGRPTEALDYQRQAVRLNREPKPYVPYLAAKRMAKELAAHVRERVEAWGQRSLAHGHLASMARRGIQAAEETLCDMLAATARALHLEQAMEPLTPAPASTGETGHER